MFKTKDYTLKYKDITIRRKRDYTGWLLLILAKILTKFCTSRKSDICTFFSFHSASVLSALCTGHCRVRFKSQFNYLNSLTCQLHTWTNIYIQFSSVQSLSCVRLFATPWITARQASLSITNSRSSLRLTSIESVMPSSHLILRCPLLLLPPIPPSIRVFSSESTLRMRWPKYWSFSFSVSSFNEYSVDFL